MPTLEGLRRQISTATDLRSVVTTMKTLAAVSIHQYERAAEALADYNRTIELGFQIAFAGQTASTETKILRGFTAAIVFGSDQGMCGQFNEQVVSRLNTKAADEGSDRSWTTLAVGDRCEDQLIDSGWNVQHTYSLPTSVSDISNLVQELLLDIDRLMTTSEIGRLVVFFNRRTSASSFKPRDLQLLPLDPARLQRFRQEEWKGPSSPIFAGERQRVVSSLVQQYLYVSLFRACAESLASENASRIAAMQAAEKNIEERLEELSRDFNTLRQSSITEELLDVVTGFEALSQQRKKNRQERT